MNKTTIKHMDEKSVNISDEIFACAGSNGVSSSFPIEFNANREGCLIFPQLRTGPKFSNT